MERAAREPNVWVATAYSYWIVGNVVLAIGTVLGAWLVTGVDHGFVNAGNVLFGVAILVIFRVLVGAALGLLFIACAAPLRPRSQGFVRSMSILGACVGALAGGVGWFGFWYLLVPFALVGAAFGAFVGARVAELRQRGPAFLPDS